LAGAFSPISVYGIFINDYLAKNGLTPTPVSLFFAPLIFNLVFAIAVYLILHRRPGLRAEADDELSPDAAVPAPEGGAASAGRAGASATAEATVRLERSQVPARIGLVALAPAVIVFGWAVGLVTITIAAVLAAIDPEAGRAAMSKVSWSVVVLITGVLTYIAVLQEAGTVEWVSAGISAIGIPLLAALLLFYMSGLISALASSLAIIGVVIALAVP